MDYHILKQDLNKKSVSVVFHIPIPAAGVNAANISWRDAIVASQGGSANIVSVLGTAIDAAEDTKLKAGELYEHPTTVKFSSINLTNAQRKAEIEAAFNDAKSNILADKQIELEWIGYEANVP